MHVHVPYKTAQLAVNWRQNSKNEIEISICCENSDGDFYGTYI